MALLPDILRAGEIDLRRWNESLVDEVSAAAAVSFVELNRWMPWARTMPTRDELRGVMQAGDVSFAADDEWQYVLWHRGDELAVGCAGLHRRDGPDTLEIGYWVRSDRTNRGHATSAAKALTAAAFTFVPGIERIEIHMDQANVASAAIPPKLGYSLDREEDRDVSTSGHTGKGFVWTIDRTNWATLTAGRSGPTGRSAPTR